MMRNMIQNGKILKKFRKMVTDHWKATPPLYAQIKERNKLPSNLNASQSFFKSSARSLRSGWGISAPSRSFFVEA